MGDRLRLDQLADAVLADLSHAPRRARRTAARNTVHMSGVAVGLVAAGPGNDGAAELIIVFHKLA